MSLPNIPSWIPRLLAWAAKPLYYRSRIKPLLHRANKHLRKKYNKSVLENPHYKITTNEKDPKYGHGYYRIYISPNELLREISENREAMILQEHIKNTLAPDLQLVEKKLHEAICIHETNELIELSDNPVHRIRLYNTQINDKNRDNEYIDVVQYADEKKQLKYVIENLVRKTKKLRKKKTQIPTTAKERLRRKINVQKNNWKKEIENIEKELDQASDKELIESTAKSFFEYVHKYSANEVVKSIVTNKPIRTNDGKILSYVLIAQVILDNPRITGTAIAKQVGKSELAFIQYGIVALLKHEKGLSLIERKKMSGMYRYFPTEHFKVLLKKHKFKTNQKELSDY